jgi:DNA processing protein
MDDLYKVAISFFDGFGPSNTKKVIAYTGSLEGLFKEKIQNILKIPGIGTVVADKLKRTEALQEAEEELKYIADNNINKVFYLDKDYPRRLSNCVDAPCTLYYKGNINFNPSRVISIVGTRNATEYGRDICNSLIKELSEKKTATTIVSGLAYGIDISAHKAAMKNGLPTFAAVGHGFQRIYPAQHKKYAQDMMNNGGLVTEFTSKSHFDPTNFLRRNRIIAGISDATIVIESANKGGSLVTANIANSYNRDVFAFPGRIGDSHSKGCNHLIKTNQAHLIESAADLEYILGWDNEDTKPKDIQTKLFIELSPEEEKISQALSRNEKTPIDIICMKTSLPMSKVSSLLLKMEFDGIIKSYPGKIYSLKD